MCGRCVLDVHNAFTYKKRCEDSDTKLREYLENLKKPQPPARVESPFIKPEQHDEKESIVVIVDPLNHGFYEASQPSPKTNKTDDDNFDSIFLEDESKCETDSDDNDPNYEPSPQEVEKESVKSAEDISSKQADGRFLCHICNRSLADPKTLRLHIRLHTGKNLKRCMLCDRGFSKQNHLTRHMRTHEKKVHQCPHCSKLFDDVQSRKSHISTEHNDVPAIVDAPTTAKPKRKRNQVDAEDTVNGSDAGAINHMSTPNGEKKCVCKICDVSFDRIAELRDHLLWHGESDNSYEGIDLAVSKPSLFDSGLVGVENASEDTLRDILKTQIQNNENLSRLYEVTNKSGWELTLTDSETENEDSSEQQNNYSCHGCQREFNRSYKIIAHMKNDHPSETLCVDFAHLKCHHCLQHFPNATILQKHLQNQCQNDQKKFICKACNHHFMWENNYKEHLVIAHQAKSSAKVPTARVRNDRLPTGNAEQREKSFTCQVCSKAFYRREHLDRHKKIHLPSEKRFSCDLCKRRFNRRDNLK